MTYGKGFLGALGNETYSDCPAPKAVSSLASSQCSSVAAGWGHTAFITVDGHWSMAGRPCDFKQTLRNINIRGGMPWLQSTMAWVTQTFMSRDVPAQWVEMEEGLLQEGEHLIHVVCSPASLTGVITSHGRVLSMGSNGFGQTGTGTATSAAKDMGDILEQPKAMVGFPEWEKVVGLAYGLEHGLAVTDAGSLYAWGRGDRGQLGLGEQGKYKQAVRLTGADGAWLVPGQSPLFVAVEAGASFSAAIDSTGRAWLWGKLQSLEIAEARGDGFIHKDQMLPRRILFSGEEDGEGDSAVGDSPSLSPATSAVPDLTEATPEQLAEAQRQAVRPAQLQRNVAPDHVSGDVILTRANTVREPVLISPAIDPYRAPDAVAALSAGHAHMTILSRDGRIWMVGRRGRGVTFDATATTGFGQNAAIADNTADAAQAEGQPQQPSGHESPQPSTSTLPAELDVAAIVPEVHMQTTPLPIPPGPLAGQPVVGLRSDLHHSYALTTDGRVFRWGWRGVVEEVKETQGVRVADIAFGYAHTALLAR